MMLFRILPALALGLLLATSVANAEQIRLADGRFLQGDVIEVSDDGFTFRLTDTGGKVFLRWNQVDEGLKKRLTNQTGVDEGLDLEVMVSGARLELIDGTVHEGTITQTMNGYRVVNLRHANGLEVSREDVLEEGHVTDIMIDADVLMEAPEVLALAEERRAPLETARQYYELARIADRLGEYNTARDYVTLALGADPDSTMQARLTEYETELEELIRQENVLELMVQARRFTKSDEYQTSLNILDEAEASFEPTGPVLEKLEETRAEIDLEYSEWVINKWYKKMRTVTREYARSDPEPTVSEALTWARREMGETIAAELAEESGSSDPTRIRARFDSRFELEEEGLIRLRNQRANFGEDGFYQVVGGHLPTAGKKPANQNDNSNRNPNRDDGRRRFPRRGRDRDGIENPDDGMDFQEEDDGIDAEDIKDILRRAIGEGGDKEEELPDAGEQDISDLEVPTRVPSLTEWWDGQSSTGKSQWLIAAYVKFGGTMRIYKYDRWYLEYK